MHPLSHTFDAIIEEKSKLSIEKEIRVLRELLANMQEESRSLLCGDKATWEKVMGERFFLLQEIKQLRAAREGVSWKSISEERDLLIEQILALVDRIDRQNKHNEAQQKVAISFQVAYPEAEYMPISKKSGLTTVL